jgi:hypothetical protein
LKSHFFIEISTFIVPFNCYPTFIWAIFADFSVILSTDSRLLESVMGRLGVGRLAALRR